MTESSISPADFGEVGDGLIHREYHDVETNGRMFITVVRAIGYALDVDVTESPLHLDRYIEPCAINALTQSRNLSFTMFHYGDYRVVCSSRGEIGIYGDVPAHEAGELTSPASMR